MTRNFGAIACFLLVFAGWPRPASAQDDENLDSVISDPPIASLISKSQANAEGVATIIGLPGAVTADAIVGVGCLDTAWVRFVEAEADGSFTAQVYAPAGVHLQVKHALPFIAFEELVAVFGGTGQGDVSAGWHTATAGTILPPAPVPPAADGSITFKVAGDLQHEGGLGYWTFVGTQGPLSGSSLPLRGTLRMISSDLVSGFDTSGVEAHLNLELMRVFDSDGIQAPVRQTVTSDLMTPTGFPISRDGGRNPITHGETLKTWSQVSEHVLEAQVETSLDIPASTPEGWYRPLVSVAQVGIPIPDPLHLVPKLDLHRSARRLAHRGTAHLPSRALPATRDHDRSRRPRASDRALHLAVGQSPGDGGEARRHPRHARARTVRPVAQCLAGLQRRQAARQRRWRHARRLPAHDLE